MILLCTLKISHFFIRILINFKMFFFRCKSSKFSDTFFIWNFSGEFVFYGYNYHDCWSSLLNFGSNYYHKFLELYSRVLDISQYHQLAKIIRYMRRDNLIISAFCESSYGVKVLQARGASLRWSLRFAVLSAHTCS